MTKHRCPIEGCEHQITQQLLMCRSHWRLVPRDLQTRVYRAWTAFCDHMSPQTRDAYFDTRKEAIDHVHKALGYTVQLSLLGDR